MKFICRTPDGGTVDIDPAEVLGVWPIAADRCLVEHMTDGPPPTETLLAHSMDQVLQNVIAACMPAKPVKPRSNHPRGAKSMTKSELIAAIAAKADLSKSSTERALDALAEVAQEALAQGDELTIPGVGKLSVKQKAARTGRNPRTGEAIEIPARSSAHFTAVKALKDALA